MSESTHQQILALLKDNPRGLSIREVSEHVKINRNSVSNYLNVLLVSGFVEVKEIGPSKVFYRSQRVPLSAMLNIVNDSVAVINSVGNIILINDTGVKVIGKAREELINKPYILLFSFFSFDTQNQIIEKVNEGLMGEESSIELSVSWDDEKEFFYVKFIPTVFADGESGVIVIAEDVSNRVKYQKRLGALHLHASELTYLDSKEKVAHSTMEIIRDLLGLKIGSFGFIEENKIVFTELREESTILELDLDGVGITVRAVNTGETQYVPDTRLDPDYVSGRIDIDEETLSELDVPIKGRGGVVGLINLESNDVDAFSLDDHRIVETLGLHVGSALNRIDRENRISRTLDELKNSEALFRGFMEFATERYVIFDMDMRYFEVSHSWLQLTGFEREDVIGKHILEVFPNLKKTGRYDVYLNLLETGEPVEFHSVESVVDLGKLVNISAFKVGEFLGIIIQPRAPSS